MSTPHEEFLPGSIVQRILEIDLSSDPEEPPKSDGSWTYRNGQWLRLEQRQGVIVSRDDEEELSREDRRDREVKLTIRYLDGELVTADLQDFEDMTPRNYLAVYEAGRAYGGPEEGGTYFDEYSLQQFTFCADPVRADRIQKVLQRYCDRQNQSRRWDEKLQVQRWNRTPENYWNNYSPYC